MTGLREQKKQKTRKALLESAVKLFGERGYEQTSMASLARAAGIGKSTIYTYFKAKSEIFIAFCEEGLEHVYRELADKTDHEDDLVDQLIGIFMADFRFVTRNRDFGRLYLREIIFPGEFNGIRSRGLDSRYIDLLISIFKICQKRGELRRDLELTFVAGHFFALYLISVSSWYSGRLQTEEDVKEGMTILFRQAVDGLGLKKRD